MGLTNFMLTCEKDNEELRKDIKYYKNYNSRLKNQLQQKDKAIDECIELVNQWKNYCNRNYEEETYDNISIQNNVHWKYCAGHLNGLLEKLQQAKEVNKDVKD